MFYDILSNYFLINFKKLIANSSMYSVELTFICESCISILIEPYGIKDASQSKSRVQRKTSEEREKKKKVETLEYISSTRFV